MIVAKLNLSCSDTDVDTQRTKLKRMGDARDSMPDIQGVHDWAADLKLK